MKKKNDFNSWRNEKKDIFAILGDNKKILMPVILVLAVAITVVIAITANRRAAMLAEAPADSDAAATFEIQDVTMEENAYPDVNALVNTYYTAMANGDSETIKSIYKGLDETEALKAVAAADYIDDFENIVVYTKPGPLNGSYVAYVYNEVKLYEYEKAIPGLETMYICTDEDGNLYINGDIADANEIEYIKNVNVQADVIDLNNKVASSYNEMVNSDEELAELLTKMRSGIQVSVGEALASSEASSSVSESADASDESSEEASEEEQEAEPETVTVRTIKATDVINIRKSDSETADVLGKTVKDEEFKELEALANGWSRIEYNGGVAYVKTEFFEVVSEETVSADSTEQETETETETEAETETKTEAESTSNKSTSTKTGKMTVKDTVRLRKSESTESEILAMIYSGSTVNVIEQYANGWAKVEYNGNTGYIKSEFLE
ncbi:Uncharacterized conserved protein YgiM, contains N-terminal SH3 domain, DUF1202 family [Butyrivibrio proteoclasticus]|uniref:Uncharacterized conserved protein YgiM, contains N-terminal SH3 domain, DUF1202 family n=1 Tax=Butyrivibrio proteoclasticus TaxID=43305 RepID=A0A1I5RQ75_9FIRM|nr:SH3 domain-containing protein [Butyrivibrio proteoclasticus]SFP60704.1 Uncharacterized conserved protein YgiM, contains N-terminal SH3 domain, DUF1202 family [Butyrivibrio proteoclasticus]